MRRITLWLLAPLAAAAVACGGDTGSSAPGEDPNKQPDLVIPDGDDNLVPQGSVAATEGALYQAVAADAGYLYGCTGSNGLHIAEIQSATNIVTVQQGAQIPGAKGCTDIAVATDGTIVFIGQAEAGGSLVALMAPGAHGETISLLGTAAIDGMAESVIANDTHVFVARGETGITIFGRNDGALAEVGSLSGGFDQALGLDLWCHSKDVENPDDPGICNRLVVANGLSGAVVVDISDPTKPVIDTAFDTYGTARRVAIVQDYAMIATVAGGVGAYDLTSSKPYPPTSSWTTHGSAVDLAATEAGVLYVANLGDLVVVDATDPGALQFMASEQIAPYEGSIARVVGVDTDSSLGYAAEWSGLWSYAYVAGRTAPDIHLAKLSLNFGLVTLKKGKGIVIENLGTEPLEIWDVQTTHGDFTADIGQAKLTLKPGGKGLLEINFEPKDDQPVEAYVTMKTNDPDEAEISIPLVANQITGAQVGAKFDPTAELIYDEYKTGNEVTVKSEHAGKVVLLAYFATW